MGKIKSKSGLVPVRVYTPDFQTEDSVLGLLALKGWAPTSTRPGRSSSIQGLSVFQVSPKDSGTFARDLVSVSLPFGLEVEEVGGHYILTEKEAGGS